MQHAADEERQAARLAHGDLVGPVGVREAKQHARRLGSHRDTRRVDAGASRRQHALHILQLRSVPVRGVSRSLREQDNDL